MTSIIFIAGDYNVIGFIFGVYLECAVKHKNDHHNGDRSGDLSLVFT